MKNIAFVIGISDYRRLQRLAASKADGLKIEALLKATGKYTDIKTVTDTTNANQLKDALRAFFASFKNDEIDEAFFYFSGHGNYNPALDEVLFCCSDYDDAKPGTTSISHTEIDDLLRLVSPNVAVKIIDACNSGAPYIKDSVDGFEHVLEKSVRSLKSFYSMASSKLDQSSYCDSDSSFFTAAFVLGALARNEGTVFYRDIQASVADAFVKRPSQTPHFVTQGTGLESFCLVTEEMRKLAARYKTGVSASVPSGVNKSRLLAEMIAKRDALFIKREEADDALQHASDSLASYAITDPVVREFYAINVEVGGSLESVPNVSQLARWAAENNWDKDYFLTVKTEQFIREVPDTSTQAILARGLARIGEPPKKVKKIVVRPVSVNSTHKLAFEKVVITFDPNKPSFKPISVFLALICSKTHVLVLSSTARVVESGWDKYKVDPSSVEWQQAVLTWRELVRDPTLLWKPAIARAEHELSEELYALTRTEDSEKSLPVQPPKTGDGQSTATPSLADAASKIASKPQ